MKAYMTNGTVDYLLSLTEKHSSKMIFLMNNSAGTVAYYEDNQNSIFVSGREYDILINEGNIKETGYIVMNNIPIADEGKPIFETSFKKRESALKDTPGFQAFKLLKPLTGNTYVVLTQWDSELSYENWTESDAFSKAHKTTSAKRPAYFLEQPFISKYSMYEPDEDED